METGMAEVIAVCTSEKTGTKKHPIPAGVFKEGLGLVGDAHAGLLPKRLVSLLAVESIEKMKRLGLELAPGDFAENITTKGIDLCHLPIGTRLAVGKEVVLEVTQIGKQCHEGCAIKKQVGKCIMPAEGIFAKVVRGGTIKPGDVIKTGD
jgi:molybdopterin adenylyltransferase